MIEMRQETNNEMDLLLRRLSRRQDRSLPDGHLSDDGDHLDADELSSYADNALPAAARAHYTEHLAECSSCRTLVVQLSSSAGLVGFEEASRVSEPSALRKFLAGLFSPMVLRYAAPALGLVVVAVIGLVVLLSREPAAGIDSVAQLQSQETRDGVITARDETVALSPGQTPLDGDRKAASNPESRAAKSRRVKEEAEPAAAAPVGAVVDLKKDAPPTREAEQPAANAAPQPAPTQLADRQQVMGTEAHKQETQARAAAASEEQNPRTLEPARREDRAADEVAAARSAPAKSKATQGGGATSRLRRDNDEEKDRDYLETRSVAGRRFRKQRGIWVDTAYNSASPTVNVTRGSEQYRALVADEPTIKTIAEQLDGQVIVVLKGRAYRIR